MIGRTNVGGGAGLNFAVKAYSALPESGKENEIAVITDTPISRYVFSSVEPESIESGLVWIDTSGETVSFSATKDGSIILYPATCRQWNGEAWEMREAHIRQGGAWTMFASALLYIFDGVEINTELTGGINGLALSGNVLTYSGAVSNGENKTYTTKNAIDLTNCTKVSIRFLTKEYSGSKRTFRLCITAGAKNGSYVTTSGLEKYIQKNSGFVGGQEELLELDVSDLTSPHYVGLAFGVSSDESGSQRATEYNVTKWWIEGSVSNESEGGGVT